MSKIQDMLDGYDDKIAGLDANISQINDQILDVQEQQDALKSTLDTIESEIFIFLETKGDWVFTYANYYSGILDIGSNVTDWEVYDIIADDAIYENITEFIVPGDQESSYPPNLLIYFKSNSQPHPVPYGPVLTSTYDSIDDETMIVMNMTEGDIPSNLVELITLVYKKNGIGWDNDSYLTTRFDEFNFNNDYIHKPFTDFEGMYGTKPMIDSLSIGKNTLQGSRDKYDESKIKLLLDFKESSVEYSTKPFIPTPPIKKEIPKIVVTNSKKPGKNSLF